MENKNQEKQQQTEEEETMELIDTLKNPEVQDKMFTQAFDIVNEKYDKVNLQNCLVVLLDKKTSKEDIVCVGLACISLLKKHSDDFESIEVGMTERIQKMIISEISQRL